VVGGVDDDGALSPHDVSRRADNPTTDATVILARTDTCMALLFLPENLRLEG
jgi:hypothetical protein